MSQGVRNSLQVEWFNVTYRSVLALVTVILAVAGAAVGTWYYLTIHKPKLAARMAIASAEGRLVETSGLQATPAVEEIVANAEVALREARVAFLAIDYDSARVAAIRSETFSRQALRMAGQGEDEVQVRFYRLEGDVRVKRAGEFSWSQANDRMELREGDQVKSSSSASAQLIYFDGTITTIQPGSLLEIRALFEDPVTQVRRVREKLNWGELNASVQKRNVAGSYHEVATEEAAARAEVEGEFRVRHDKESQTSTFDNFSGKIEIDSGTRKESLVAGETIKAQPGGRLGPKTLLPATPRLLSPRDQRVFTAGSGTDVTLSWEPVPGSGSYHLIIADTALFTDPLYDDTLTETSVVLSEVEQAAYYWKVAALSPAGVNGPFSTTRRFRVAGGKIRDTTDDQPPILEITEFVSVGTMVIVNGRTEPGASLWVDEEKIDVDDSGTFYAVVRLRKEGVNELAFVAQDAAGNEARIERQAYAESF
jgi:hypothetical protein